MDLLNEQVTHKSFGKGSVVAHDDDYVEVRFPLGVKKFVFPDVFGTHLLLVDPKLAKHVDGVKLKIERERKKEEAELEAMRAIEEARRKRALERERLLKNHRLSPASQVAFWCDPAEQDKVFSEWRVFTGRKKSGANQGEPNRLVRLHQNSCCLITAREPDVPEKDRRVVGLFMVGDFFVGKLCEDGYIPAHLEYRLRLSEEESRKILFWNYYVNERYPNNMTWNSGRYRYFDNVWMAQILQDIVALKEGSAEFELVQDFLEHFCDLNRLVETELPRPNGALVRNSA
ncbi:MAG TPA: malate synthase [Firmicutes bacterium]|jgi:hypothetical protein|nr:malate synthase [Bacillota bacterium]